MVSVRYAHLILAAQRREFAVYDKAQPGQFRYAYRRPHCHLLRLSLMIGLADAIISLTPNLMASSTGVPLRSFFQAEP